MPNHITNVIEFDCSPERFRQIAEFLRGTPDRPLGTVDFNTLLPMPETMNIEAGSRGDTGLRAYREFMKEAKALDHDAVLDLEKKYREQFKEDPEIWDLGKQYYSNIENYGAPNWYDWCIRNWGTKWNAYECSQVEPETRVLTFNTAWSGVPEIIEKISEKFPDVKVLYSWADEDIGFNVGSFTMKDGQVTAHNIPAPGSREAYEMAAAIMDADLSDWGLTLTEDGTSYEWKEDSFSSPENKSEKVTGDAR